MADRLTAEIFRMVFEFLAERRDDRGDRLAMRLWSCRSHFDFTPAQMYCDEALLVLGLAERSIQGGVRYRGERILEWDEGTGL